MIEDKIWDADPNQYIIGSDEVGRGCFAGPISAAAVKINYSHIHLLNEVKDSKKLSAKKEMKYLVLLQKIIYIIRILHTITNSSIFMV